MKKILALLLAVVMLLTVLPVGVFAENADDTGEAVSVPTGINADAATALIGAVKSDAKAFETQESEIDPDTKVTVIVVLDESEIPTDGRPTRAAQNRMLKQQAAVQKEISEAVLAGKPVQIENSYCTLTNGFSTTVTYGQLQEIRKLDSVKSAFIAPHFEVEPNMATSNGMVGGGMANTTGFNGEGMVIAILDTGIDLDHEIFATAPVSPRMTQADVQSALDQYDLHCEADVPSIGASTLYYSAKLPFQFDYGDHDADGNPTEGGEHGTHVAATAAGNEGVKENFSGVAPQAQLLDMKVFKQSGGASYDDILAALEDCMVLGVDAVNMSLGSVCGFIDYETEDEWVMNLIDVFNRTGESGICMAVAVGNDYSAAYNNNYGGKALASNPDYGNAGEPSTYDESLSVAAVENAGMVSPYITVGGRNIAYYDGYDGTTQEITTEYAFRTIAGLGSLEYVFIDGYGTVEDFEGHDLRGKIAVVSRGGGLYYETKCNNASAAGAIGLIVYNDRPGMVYMSIESWTIPIAFISQSDGAYLGKQSDKHLTIAKQDALVTSPVAGMCDFSCWGATSELTLKPEITAPGGNIYSAVPGNGYELMSGTSMASPHVAGGMAIVLQALKAKGLAADAGEAKDLVDTLLMSTAAIIYDGDTPVSPRKQGAGLMNINAAASAEAYITVDGMERPKMELGDDVDCTGVYTLSFNVHNLTNETRYYKAAPIVLTDATEEKNGAVVMTETDVPLAHTYTTNFENDLVVVPANSTVPVTITVTLTNPEATLAAFENGAFVEGWAVLDAANADGSVNEDGTDLNAPFLAFYGDWTKAPMIDSAFWWDAIESEETSAQVYNNEALLGSMENTYVSYLGDNNYDYTIKYLADRNAISPNGDDFQDSLTWVYTGLLRSARRFSYTITGEDGTVYYEKSIDYEVKSVYDSKYYSIVPAGAISDYGDTIDPWYGTDKLGSSLPSGTKATVTITAEPMYDKHPSNNVRSSWSFPITIDTEAPEVLDMTVREAEGRFYATITVRDNEYVAAVVLTDAKYDKEFTVTGVGELEAGKTTVLEDIDITGYGETIGVVVHDYAGNTKTYYLRAKGNTDDYAEVEVTDDMVLYSENFDNAWLPAGWSVESKSGAPKTWYRDEYNMAAIDPDEVYNQNEWLFTPSYDLSGQSTPTHMVFDFETSYTFCVQYPHFNVNVYASKDNGATWESIWNLHDSGLYSDWTRTQAKVVIPDDYQGCNNVRFAFVYTGDTGGAQFAFDNMRIYKDRAEDYIAVTASAGENGTISPEGRTLVRKGTSKTFTAIPNEGYEVASMVVDGTDLGAIGYYTFETVGVDHTIDVSFQPISAQSGYTVKAEATEGGIVTPSGTISVGAGESKAFDFKADEGYQLVAVRVNGRKVTATESYTLENIDQNYYLLAKFEKIPETPEVLFEQDFEDTTFPPEGWSILGGSETWRRYSYYYLNKTQNAYISAGEAAQDERLVSPSVDLTGAEDTNLEFDYAYPYYGLKRNEFTFTLEASTDAGTTWTTIWDAKDTLEDSLSGYVVTDRAFVTLPTELCVSNVIFAWRYTRAAGDNYGIAAIDNIKLEATGVNTDIAGQAKITATAGEGGIITPSGRVYVTEGEDQTFTITPVVGFAIEDVLVDGVSVGAVDSYTFTNVTGTHTISASFKVSSSTPGVIFENDFEDSIFPSRGWSVKSLGFGSNTWEQGTFSYVSGTKVALVLNEYEDWSNAPKQNELLISPTVDLTGIEPTLEFDYAFGRYDLFNGTISLTLEASLDGGETWTKIWDASTLENNGYLYQSGHAEVEIPAFYCKDGVSFAFRYTKQNGYEGEKAGIDNVKLVDPSALCEHPTTEIRNARTATCTEDGYAGDTYCTVCNALLAAGQVIPATGHTMMPTVANAPTCTENGNIAYWTCSVCNKIFSDETGEKEITLADTVIAASGHTAVVDPAVPATCTENGKTEGSHCTVCNTVLVAQETIPAAGHKPVADSAVPATCTENGKTEGSHCSVCNEILVAQETIPAAGHKLTATAEKAPTCTESGNTAYWTCSVCKKSFSDAEGTHEIALSNTVIAATGHSFGEWAVVEYPTCTANGKQERVCTVCGAKEDQLLLATDCPSEKMTDVPKNAWYHDAVDYMMARGLMGGDSATTFSPEGTLTRAQLVTVLYRIAGSPTVNGKHQFTDVPTNQWYSDAICWAAQNGVVNGVTPTTFVPQAPITREQIATILYRYAKSEPVKENKLIAFPDADKVNEYAVEAMNWAVAEGLIAGSEGMLLPQDSATRAQIATVLMRWLERE